MAAARASLLEVHDARRVRAPRRAQRPHPRRLPGRDREATACPATPSASAPRAASPSRPTKIVDYETYKENQDGELADLAWLYNMNRGVFMTPGPRGGVDALRRPLLRGLRRVRRRLRGDGCRPHRVEFGDGDGSGSRSRGRSDASGRLVRRPGDPAAGGRAHLRAHLAVRGPGRPRGESRRLLHVLRGADPDRGRARHRGRPARVRQRLPPPRAPDRAGRREPQGAPVPVPRLDVRPRRHAAQGAALGARARLRQGGLLDAPGRRPRPGGRSSSSTPTPRPGRSPTRSGRCPGTSPQSGVDLDRLRFRVRNDWEIECDWKIAIENYLECYHCAVAHPGFSKVIDVGPDEYLLRGRGARADAVRRTCASR